MVEATRKAGAAEGARNILLKIIIETFFLTDSEKEIAARLVRDSGADFVKTSTGTVRKGASVEDIRLIRRAIGPSATGIKASGGIKNVQSALQMLDAGANRIGTSSGGVIYDAYHPEEYA
jgi:deoxyribose-phosphate aldolase